MTIALRAEHENNSFKRWKKDKGKFLGRPKRETGEEDPKIGARKAGNAHRRVVKGRVVYYLARIKIERSEEDCRN